MTKPSRFGANRNGKQTVTIHMQMGEVRSLFADLKEKISEAARPAAQAGAQVLYEAVLKNVDAIGSVTGSLKGSIYQAYSKSESGPGKATYHVSYRTSDAALDDNGQPIRTGLPTAPHGHLLEFGYVQRYAVHLGDDGKWYTLVRPSMRGKKKPKRKASQAEKDAFYVLRKGGPKHVSPRPFIRPAQYKMGAAMAAARAKLIELVTAK